MSNHQPEASASEVPEQRQPAMALPPRLSLIGIGASAGGLTALRAFFSALPERNGLVFVVVVHLSPEHESRLAELLQPYTAMPVMQVTEQIHMEPDHVYVIPPTKNLTVTDDALDLVERTGSRSQPMQIDAFFRSLAENHGDGGAVILSGSGSDGAVGIQAIKERGGIILVQAPDEAEYDGMPRSAIATGLVDIVAPVAELAVQLVAAKQTRATLQLPTDGEMLTDAGQQTLTQILTQLRVRTGHDFSGYKQATLLRRIARRMQLTQLTTLTAYLHRLRQDSDEVDALFRDLLINVTEFFRDRDAWAMLETTIIPQLFAGKGRDDTVRVWTVGCATGEEAYSLAILLLEYISELIAPPAIQVFASDLGQAALDFAREGCYPEAIAADLTEARLARFFAKDNSHYRVRPELREVILFTQHNLLQDPPFSRLDLIVCRNLLIYIQRELQEKVFETFYYALRPNGYLFLGNAESAEGATELFDTIDKRHRFYQRHVRNGAMPILPSLPLLSHPVRPLGVSTTMDAQPNRPHQPPPHTEHQRLLEFMAPPSLLVDRDYNVLHLSETAGRYLLPPGGVPTVDAVKLVRPELQAELRTALLRTFAENKAISTRPIPVRFNGAPHLVYLMVRPHQPTDGPPRAVVIFLEDETPVTSEEGAPEGGASTGLTLRAQHLEAELRHTQGRLQSTREEYETTVEELRAANEELQSTNEEYKSTLEELETSKEELQSINEELQTINQELKTKIEEVTHAHNDVQNLFVATDMATLFLDRDLRVKRYTPRAADLFNLMPPDRGRPIAHLRSNLLYEQLEADAQQVLAHLIPVEREVQSQDKRWFLVCLRPYRTLEDKIDGVVITFVDITTNKDNELALRDAKEYAESIVHTIPDALLVLEPTLRVQLANDAFYEIFQVQRDTTEGRLIYELGNGQWNIPALRKLLEEILPENKFFIGYEVEHTFEQIGRRTMLVNARRLDHVQLILLAITDITERKRAEEALRASEEKYRTLFESIDEGFCIMERVAVAPLDFRYLEANPAFAVQSGVQDVIGKTIRQVVPGEPEEWFSIYDRVLQTREPIRFERELVYAGRVLELYAFPVASPSDHRLAVIFNDITERKRREGNLAFLAEVSADFAPLVSEQEVMERVGVRLAHHLNLSRCDFSVVDEPADRITTIYDWRADEALPSVLGEHKISTFLNAAGRQTLASGNISVIDDVRQNSLLNAPAEMMQALGIGAVLDTPYLEHGRWLFLLSICRAKPTSWHADEIELIRELTTRLYIRMERARAEEALRASEQRFRSALEIDTVGVIYFQPDGQITDANQAFLLMTGYTRADLAAGQVRWETMTPPEWLSRSLQATHELQSTGRATPYEKECIRKDGSRWWGLFSAQQLTSAEVVEFIVDITKLKETELALQHLNATLEQQVDTRTTQVRALASELTMAEQSERRRISQILHDDLQQLLYGMQMRMMAIMNDLEASNYTSVASYAQEVYNWLGDAIQTTRQLTVDISPPVLKHEGLADTLRWLVSQMASVNGLQVELQTTDAGYVPDEDMRVLLFQIVRELLFNVVKHAQTDHATVELHKKGDDVIVITVRDQGRGFTKATTLANDSGGFGLYSVNERLKLFGGQMDIQSTPGQGTTITISVPVGTPTSAANRDGRGG